VLSVRKRGGRDGAAVERRDRAGASGRRPGPQAALAAGLLAGVLFWAVSLAPGSAAAQDEPPSPATQASPPEGSDDPPSSWLGQPNVGYGPYHQAALGFWNSLRLGFTPRPPVSLPDGTFEVRATESWAKVIAEKDQSFNLDYEVLRTQASISYGLSNDTLVDLDFDTATRVHGILDPLMNGFHNTFAIPLGPRGRLPDNSFRIELEPGQGRPPITLDHDAGRPFTRSAVVSLQNALTYGDENVPALSWSVSIRPPLGHFEPLQEGSPVDLSGSFSLSKGYGDFYVYAAVSFSLYGDESYSGTGLKAYQWASLGALEWNCLGDVSVVCQCLVTSGAVDSFGPFTKPSYELCYGFKWEIARNFRLDFAMLHDVVNPINSPDFGFQLELSLRW
jgi:hypothetical protein